MYVFDIDGTIADLSHRLVFIEGEKRDWGAFYENCHGDEPINGVINVLQALQAYGQTIEFWTGRPEVVRTSTRRWLRRYVGSWTDQCTLRMRPDGSHAPDTEVKAKFLEHFHPEAIFEDRASVADMWRSRGIRVFQVARGDY